MERKRRIVALFLSAIIVGAGQLYRKRYLAGIVFLLIAVSSAVFLKIIWSGFNYSFIGVIAAWIILWAVNVIDAYKGPFIETAPCEDACPVGIGASDYVALVAANRFDDARSVILRQTPFVGTLGRICPAPCETKCSRSGTDTSIAIRHLKRVISDVTTPPDFQPPSRPGRVAVIGGGPCGLTCAYDLRCKGYEVSVFEKEETLGGMLTQCIPEFRLPMEIVMSEIALIKRTGVEIRTGVQVGKDIGFEDIQKEHDAVLVATGTQDSRQLNIEGEWEPGIHYGLEFLRATRAGNPPDLGDSVIVIGCGNTAFDSARTAIRLGCQKVSIFYRRTIDVAPAEKGAIYRAEEEGLDFRFLVTPIAIEKMDSGALRVRFSKTSGDEFEEEITSLIVAIGQTTQHDFLSQGIKTSGTGTIVVDRHMRTNKPRVFAAGDVATGPSTVAQAIGTGKRAAESIDSLLGGWRSRLDGWLQFDESLVVGKVPDAAWLEKTPKPRERMQIACHPDRTGFDEVELVSSEEASITEAKRCLRCSHRFRS
jgi:NADPH-dependent glutamate synthase beta subunit-like oxidoreductase/TM2 domain-containing membrane protein YozV